MTTLKQINFMKETQFKQTTPQQNQLYLVEQSIMGEPDLDAAVDFSGSYVAEETFWGNARGKASSSNTALVMVNGLTAYYNFSPNQYVNTTDGWFPIPKGSVISSSGTFDYLRRFPIKKEK